MRTMSRGICYWMIEEKKPDYFVIIAEVQNEHQTDKLMLFSTINVFMLEFFFSVCRQTVCNGTGFFTN